MKTKLYNLNSLYDPSANFTQEICKIGDNGQAYTDKEIKKYKNYYSKKMGKEFLLDLISNSSRDHFKYFFKNYQSSKYYKQLKKIYYYLLK